MRHVALALGLALCAQGCSDNDFASDGQKRAADAVRADGRGGKGDSVPALGNGKDLSKPQSSEGPSKPGRDDEGLQGPSPDDVAIGKCLEKWGAASPFAADAGYRKIHASVQVLGKGKGIVDDVRTEKPELVLITAAVSVLGKTSYELLNPNGWYCMKVDVNVLTDVTVKLECGARMADNQIDVGVLSNSQPVGGVGVHVLSDVKIERQKPSGAACE